MKFRFKFAAVEKHRKIMMDLARRDYLEAQSQVDAKLAEIKGLYQTIDDARERAAQGQMNGTLQASDLVQIDEFINGQNIRIDRARREVRELMSIAEDKHEILLEKVKEHKAMLKLRERHFEEFKQEVKKISQKQMDDQAVMRFKARG